MSIQCIGGSGLRPGVPGTTPVSIRFADLRNLAIPDLSPYGVSPVFDASGLNIIGFTVSGSQILAPEFLSTYGLLYGIDIAANFCASPPPVEFPGLNQGLSELARITAENLWHSLCRCNENTPCDYWQGRGGCAGINYSITASVTRDVSGGVGEPKLVDSQLTIDCDVPGIDQGGIYGQVGVPYIDVQGQFQQLRLPCKGKFGQDRDIGISNQANAPIVSFEILSLSRCDGLPDDCCGEGNTPDPDPFPDDVVIDPDGGTETVIVYLPVPPSSIELRNVSRVAPGQPSRAVPVVVGQNSIYDLELEGELEVTTETVVRRVCGVAGAVEEISENVAVLTGSGGTTLSQIALLVNMISDIAIALCPEELPLIAVDGQQMSQVSEVILLGPTIELVFIDFSLPPDTFGRRTTNAIPRYEFALGHISFGRGSRYQPEIPLHFRRNQIDVPQNVDRMMITRNPILNASWTTFTREEIQ